MEEQNKIDNVWDEVNQQAENSKIKRYNWKKILGETLTHKILSMKNKGYTPTATFEEITTSDEILDYLRNTTKEDRINMLKNIRISVSARYGETNTAKKIEEEEDEPTGDNQIS